MSEKVRGTPTAAIFFRRKGMFGGRTIFLGHSTLVKSFLKMRKKMRRRL